MQQSSATSPYIFVFRGSGRLLHALNHTLQCFLVSTVFGTVSSLHLTSFLMIFTLVCHTSWHISIIITCIHYSYVVLFMTHLILCALSLYTVVVESYELTGRHTYLATAISAGCALVLLLSLAALHKNLAPKSKRNKDKDDDDLTVSATCKLSLAVTESETPGIKPPPFFLKALCANHLTKANAPINSKPHPPTWGSNGAMLGDMSTHSCPTGNVRYLPKLLCRYNRGQTSVYGRSRAGLQYGCTTKLSLNIREKSLGGRPHM